MQTISRPLGASLFTCLTFSVLAVWTLVSYNSVRDDQLLHAAHIQHLVHGTKRLAGESRSLLQQADSLTIIQSLQDQNIIEFQAITNGSLKQGLPPLDDLLGTDLTNLNGHFNQFSNHVSSLLQSRTRLTQLAAKKEDTLLASRDLADKASDLAQGILQYGASTPQVSTAYELALVLAKHHLNVNQVFNNAVRYSPLDLDYIRSAVGTLTSGGRASDSAILRRSAAHLLDNIKAFSAKADGIQEFSTLEQSVSNQVTQLQTAQTVFADAMETVEDQLLSGYTSLWLLTAGLWLAAVVSALAGTFLALNKRASAPKAVPMTQPEAASEITSSHVLNQIKTDKNKLMNDIRPLADGILYIRADEHYESTSDLARCFNHSREALIQRIEHLRALAESLQSELAHSPMDDGEQIDIQIDTKPLEDLTYKAQAELEGIIRRTKSLSTEGQDNRKLILAQCLRTDHLLDEIRVRIRKGWRESIVDTQNSDNPTSTPNGQEEIRRIVDQLTRYLDEFQTTPPSKRSKRAG